jgi:cytosine/adenosine deaminase-related metal-dependent hydrolase
MIRQTIQADLTWSGGGFLPGHAITVGADGRIESIGPPGRGPVRRLEGVALLAGFVNAHSHAVQRGLRGSGERFAWGAGGVWRWRGAG